MGLGARERREAACLAPTDRSCPYVAAPFALRDEGHGERVGGPCRLVFVGPLGSAPAHIDGAPRLRFEELQESPARSVQRVQDVSCLSGPDRILLPLVVIGEAVHRSEERRVGKSVDLGGRRSIKEKSRHYDK